MTPNRILLLLAALLGILAAPRGGLAGGIEQKTALCSACHGADGKPVNPAIPVIWGQNEGYLYLELRDLKLGNRKSQVMGPIAATLEKQDMRDLAAYFAAKSWPALGQPTAPAEVAARAEKAINAAVCQSCHLANWQGNGTTPRLGGQERAYLQATMTAFHDNTRANNPWMSALLKTYSVEDLDAMAAYFAGQP
jgi:cytochrome c553